MSQENVEFVRSIYAAWERGDYRSIDWADPKIEYVIIDGPAPGSWTGHAGLAEGWAGVMTAFEEFSTQADEFRELDHERVLVIGHHSGRGRSSGMDLGRMQTQTLGLFHVRDGKVTRFVTYWDRERGFADLGLSEQDPHADS